MLQLGKMAKQLQPEPTTAKIIKQTPTIPSLETILQALKDKLPSENLPTTQTCGKIGDVFNKLHCAHKAYADAAETLAELSTEVTPNPDASALTSLDENSATRVLAAAIYSKLEHLFFDETLSRADISMAFRCNILTLTKAITGVDYKGGPKKYIPKKAVKRRSDTAIAKVKTSKCTPTATSST